ncbi:MAG: fused MFS/spermidine synthase [Thermoanaerobaculales bacterium]|nr:fused MFS/spermidine synthase [Thermoanaerobaculales bacterium]
MPNHHRRHLSLLALSAFASGLAALVLQLQWGRQLALVFGGSHHAVAAVLTAFMLGLGIGSLLGGRIADRLRRPALAIAVIELALVVLAPLLALALVRVPVVAAGWLPAAASSTDAPFLISRLALALVLLVTPTTLMGATYPILVRAAARDVDTLHRGIGRLYAVNTLGGVAGVVLAAFAILPVWGIPGSVAAAATANGVAAAAALLAHRIGNQPSAPQTETAAGPPLPWTLLAAAAGSGAVVLGAETLWHRALKMVLANSTATLGLLLALTLAGLGLGAAIGTPLLRRQRPLAWWTRLQLAAVGLTVVQACLMSEIAVLARFLRPDTGWARVLVPPLTVGGAVILPVALLFGAAWPLLLAAATPTVDDGGRRIGRMGIANAFGAAAGAAVVGMVILPAVGLGRSMLLIGAAGAAVVLLALAAPLGPVLQSLVRGRRLATGAAVVLTLAALAAPNFGQVLLPSLTRDDDRIVLSYHETASGTVVVTEEPSTGARGMYVDNNAVIGATYDALKVARMLGLVPTLLHPEPRRVLVIGFGAGVTTATVAGDSRVESLDVVEIVPGVVEAADLFGELNHHVARDPRLTIHANDGRNHLLLHPGPWDIITCDPVHPLFGSSPLYSLEFFTLARSRLARGGVVCQYLPLHRMPDDAFRRAIATFQTAFPDSWVFFGLGHAMLVGSDGPLDLDWERWLTGIEHHALRDDLATSALHHPAQIAALLQLDPEGCRAVGAGAPATDLHPRLEFLAPAAYEPGLWPANARTLVEAYTSPVGRIANLPPDMGAQLQRLVAGKRLLLFSLLERTDGNLEAARTWLGRAVQVAGDDPEIVFYARQLEAEMRGAVR